MAKRTVFLRIDIDLEEYADSIGLDKFSPEDLAHDIEISYGVYTDTRTSRLLEPELIEDALETMLNSARSDLARGWKGMSFEEQVEVREEIEQIEAVEKFFKGDDK